MIASLHVFSSSLIVNNLTIWFFEVWIADIVFNETINKINANFICEMLTYVITYAAIIDNSFRWR